MSSRTFDVAGIHSIRLILPTRVLADAWIRFEDGRIACFGQGEPPQADFVDGKNDYLAPGFIDLHVHGDAGADFLDGTAEAFRRIAAFHLAGGTTALCPTLATTTYERIEAITAVYDEVKGQTPSHLLPLHLEGPHLARAKAGAQDPTLLLAATDRHIDWLVEHAQSISQMTVAPELANADALITRLSEAGIAISLGHTEATEQQAAHSVRLGARKVTHQFNAMSSAAKVGLFRQAGLAEYALTQDALVCELIGDGFHVAPTLARMAFRCKGPSRIALVSDALAGVGLPVGSLFTLGRLQCRVQEGYCSLADGSAISGSATRLIDQVRVMVTQVGLALEDAVRMASLTPASVLHIQQERGSIATGLAADVVQFDEQWGVQSVRVGGREMLDRAADAGR